jgi:LmbE family N-acetylglucosaminyl deacetylase
LFEPCAADDPAVLSVDPAGFFPGQIVLVVPHMDDEALACGGLIARLPDKERVHLIYATDGMKSPAPVVPGRDAISPDLGRIRMQESKAAMQGLGVPERNLRFLGLPEGQLPKHRPALEAALRELFAEIRPGYAFIPFRYDRHPDHLAVNHIVSGGQARGWPVGQLIEYFVYYRSRLLPARDVRKYIAPQHLISVDIQDIAPEKRKALDCFRSQTTIYYSWQTRPILTPQLLDQECQSPEVYLVYRPGALGPAVFAHTATWIRLAHRVEPILLKCKYLITAFLTRAFRKQSPLAKAANQDH